MRGKHVLVGVTGGIAAYKAGYLVRDLVKSGTEVKVMMTEAEHVSFHLLRSPHFKESGFHRSLDEQPIFGFRHHTQHIDLPTGRCAGDCTGIS